MRTFSLIFIILFLLLISGCIYTFIKKDPALSSDNPSWSPQYPNPCQGEECTKEAEPEPISEE